MNLQQFFIILIARRREWLYTLLGSIAFGLVLSLVYPSQYKASTDIVVDVKSPDPVIGMVLPGLSMPGYMATQVDIISSDRVAWRVVKLLRLDENPDIKQQWLNDTDGKGTIVSWLATLLQKKLDVKPSRESNVVTISYKNGDPKFAATLANAFAQAYIDTNIELQVEPARQYSKWFQEQGRTTREQLEKARATLSEYQQKTGIVAADQRFDAEVGKLNELSTQLTLSQTQSADAQSKQKAVAGDTLPEVIQSPLIQGLKSNIAQLEGKLQEMAGNLGQNHPQYKRNQAELSALRQQLDAETRNISESISTNHRISKGKEAELRMAIEEQKQKLLQLNNQRDPALVLQQDVDNAQKAYDAVALRISQADMQSKAVQTNVSVLTPAVEPTEPWFPNLWLNLLLSIFLGGLLGVGVVFVKENADRRVRSSEDVIGFLELPLLASVQKPGAKPEKWWQRLSAMVRGRRIRLGRLAA